MSPCTAASAFTCALACDVHRPLPWSCLSNPYVSLNILAWVGVNNMAHWESWRPREERGPTWQVCASPRERAQEMATQLAEEDGAARGMAVFHKHLPIQALRGGKVRRPY